MKYLILILLLTGCMGTRTEFVKPDIPLPQMKERPKCGEFVKKHYAAIERRDYDELMQTMDMSIRCLAERERISNDNNERLIEIIKRYNKGF